MELVFNIYSPPGMDPAEIAAQVTKRLDLEIKRNYESRLDRFLRRIFG